MNSKVGCFFQVVGFCALFGWIIADVGGGILGLILGLFFYSIIASPLNKWLSDTDSSTVIDGKVLEAVTELSWIIMKTDDEISQSELYVFRDYMLQNFGAEATADAIKMMQYLQYEKVSSQKATHVINVKLNYPEKMQILQYLFQLAASDGEMHSSEYEALSKIATEMQILQTDFIYLKNAYNYMYNRRYSSNQNQYSSVRRSDSLEDAYAVLGLRSANSNEEIKAAYRRLAIANHPDKVQHLGETAHKEAEKRFSLINEAYNKIKKARNL